MDALRQVALAEHTQISEPDAARFHRLFLGVVRLWGRSHEVVLLAGYKFWTLNLLSDLDSGARMLAKGKIPLLPHPVRPHREIRRLFAAVPTLDDGLPEILPQASPDSTVLSARQEAADVLVDPEQTVSRAARDITPPAGMGEDDRDPAGSEGDK
jgi:hypothetical protein